MSWIMVGAYSMIHVHGLLVLETEYRTTANVPYTVNIQTCLFQRVLGTIYLKQRAIF
jgi:hypothetical protein